MGGHAQEWLLIADAQPQNMEMPTGLAQIAKWKQICLDIAARHPNLDAIYFEGDLITYANQPYGAPGYYHFDNWIDDIGKIGVPLEYIYPIAGNHDAHWVPPYNNQEFLKFFRKLNYVSFNGNFLNIHISDARRDASAHTGHMNSATLAWLTSLVRGHQDTHNIILHLHQPIGNTTVGSSMLADVTWRQEDSPELAKLIRDDPRGKVDLVLHGHNDHGLPGGQPAGDNGGSTSVGVPNQVNAHTTWHVNVGLHIPSYLTPSVNPGNLPMSYCTAEVEEGASHLTLKRWNVETGDEVVPKRLIVPLRHPARIANGQRWDTRADDITRQQRGTWIPSIKFTGGNGTFAPVYASQLGTFIRDGDVVHFSLTVAGITNAYTGASGQLVIDLPLLPDIGYYTGVSLGQMMGLVTSSSARALTAYVAAPTTANTGIYIREYGYFTPGSSALLGPAHLPANTAFNIIIGGSYILPENFDTF